MTRSFLLPLPGIEHLGHPLKPRVVPSMNFWLSEVAV